MTVDSRFIYLLFFICTNIVRAYFPDIFPDGDILLPVWCMGATYYVDGTMPNNAGDGTTPATAKKYCTSGIALLSAGDSLYVRGGLIYRPTSAGAYVCDIDASGVDGTAENPVKIYLDWTGTGTERSRDPDKQAILLASWNLSTGYKWTQSTNPTEYYLEAAAGGTPGLGTVKGVWIQNADGTYTAWTSGTVGSLTDHTWAWVASASSPDSLAYNTLYVRDDSGDPDATGVIFEVSQANAAIALSKDFYEIYGGIQRFGGLYSIYITSAADTPKLYNTRTQYAVQHGVQTYADNSYHYGCVSDHNASKGFQIHKDGSTLDADLDAYYYNCTSAYNQYGFVAYGKMHLRNSIGANNTLYQFFKQVADPSSLIDPDEENNVWYGGVRIFDRAGDEAIPAINATSINGDPLFRSATDFRLKGGSPAINAGADVGLTTDFLGNDLYGIPDIGAYEYIPLQFTAGWGDNWERKTIYDSFYVDSGLSLLYASEPTQELTGLDHLAGTTVSLLVDGVVHPDTFVNYGGGVSLQWAGTTIHAGLSYPATYRSVNLEGGSRMGTAIGQIKRIIKVILNLYNTSGGKIGFDDGTLEDIQIPSWKAGTSLFTGDLPMLFQHGYDTEAYVQVTQDDPLPMTVLNVIPVFDTREK